MTDQEGQIVPYVAPNGELRFANTAFLNGANNDPTWTSKDDDGDIVMITTGKYPDGRHGVYFRTSPMGSLVLVKDAEALREKLDEIITLMKAKDAATAPPSGS